MIAKKFSLEDVSTSLSALFFIALLVTGDSYVWGPFALFLLALTTFNKSYRHAWNKDIRLILMSLLPYFLITALSIIIMGGSIDRLDMPSRVIAGAFVLLFLVHFKPNAKALLYSIPVGCIVASIVAIYHYSILDSRAFMTDGYMVIQASGLCASLSVFSLTIFFFAKKTQNKPLSIISFIGFFLSLFSCFLAGSKGVFILTPFIVLWITIKNRTLISRKLALGSFIILLLGVSLTSSYIQDRATQLYGELQSYSQESANTSAGIRIELWKSATYSFLDKPLFGEGYDGVRATKQKQYEEGKIGEVALGSKRAHNQFFEELQTKGLLGLSALLLLFCGPFYYFWKLRRSSELSAQTECFSLLGMAHILLVIGYCLTQHYLNHHSGIILYVFGTVIFLAICIDDETQQGQTS